MSTPVVEVGDVFEFRGRRALQVKITNMTVTGLVEFAISSGPDEPFEGVHQAPYERVRLLIKHGIWLR